MTLSIIAVSTMASQQNNKWNATLSIMAHSIMVECCYAECHVESQYAECHKLAFMLSVMLNANMLSVIMLKLIVIMLSIVMLSVVVQPFCRSRT
jgi:hypothetical protein